MKVTIPKDHGYVVADVSINGWLWGNTPTVSVIIKPRDETPKLAFDIEVNDWMELSGKVTIALSQQLMRQE